MSRPIVSFARLFERIMGAPPPFEIPEYRVLSTAEVAGAPHEVMIGSKVGRPVLVQAEVAEVWDQPPGWFQAGFWGHGVNSEFVYLGQATERYTLFLRLPYGAGVYCSDPAAERRSALAALARYSSLAAQLPVKHAMLIDAAGEAFYRLERHDGRVVESGRDRWFSLDEVDLMKLATE